MCEHELAVARLSFRRDREDGTGEARGGDLPKAVEARGVFGAPEGETPVSIQAVPSEQCRLGRDASHRLDGIPHQIADTAEVNAHESLCIVRPRPIQPSSNHSGPWSVEPGIRPNQERQC